jgi:F0F1-type ATP synthase membrane subunit b/b'
VAGKCIPLFPDLDASIDSVENQDMNLHLEKIANELVAMKAAIEVMQATHATKEELQQFRIELEAEVQQLRREMHAGFQQLRSEMHAGLQQLRSEKQADLQKSRDEMQDDEVRQVARFALALAGNRQCDWHQLPS